MVAQLTAWDSCVDGEFAAESGGETLPELPGMVVEEHGARVVVGLRIKGGAQVAGIRGVGGTATAGAPVGAVVDRAERGCGDGGEDARVVADGGGDVSAVVSGEAGADQVVGVARVGPGAGRAAGGAAVAAGDAEASARLVRSRVAVQGLAGGLVLVGYPAAQMDGVGAAAGAADLVLPAGVVGGRGHPEDVPEDGRVELWGGHGPLLLRG